MIVVIIAGGSGSRLWPLSTPDYPKHLLSVDGSKDSLLQTTYKRAAQLGDTIYVVTESGHTQHVRDQLPELPEEAFIVEPARRGTASCIIAALACIGQRHDANEPIAFMHADHYIRDTAGFLHSLQSAGIVSAETKQIVLIGIEPSYPATGFGYIQKGEVLDEQRFIFNVKDFQEKPDHATALKYLSSGNYLWNGGYFVGSLDTFKTAMAAVAPSLLTQYEQLLAASEAEFKTVYMAFQSIAIDYALIEKVTDLLVVPASFDWMDLGSFGDLHTAIAGDSGGNYVQGAVETEAVENSYINNQEDKPVVVIGLDNVVVVNTPHGILVARKDAAQQVGEVSKRLIQQ